MTDRLPDFMIEDAFNERPEYWEARAYLIGHYKNDPRRLAEMLASTGFGRAKDVDEWSDLSECYPDEPLPSAKRPRRNDEDVAARAFILKQAIIGLLQLHDAPAAMRRDLDYLLDSFLINPAPVRARVQALRMANPGLSWSEICDLAGHANYRQVMRDKKDWIIAHKPKD